MFEEVENVVGRVRASPAGLRGLRSAGGRRCPAGGGRRGPPPAEPSRRACRQHGGAGLAAKGSFNLMIAAGKDDLDRVKTLLDRLGFQPQPGPDPFPEDRPLRVGAWDYRGETFLLHVHVIPADSPEGDEMRFFRTCLRGDPELARAYVACKRRILESGVTDRSEYLRRKGEFIKEVLG